MSLSIEHQSNPRRSRTESIRLVGRTLDGLQLLEGLRRKIGFESPRLHGPAGDRAETVRAVSGIHAIHLGGRESPALRRRHLASQRTSKLSTLFPQVPAAFDFWDVGKTELPHGRVAGQLHGLLGGIGHEDVVGVDRVDRLGFDEAAAQEIEQRAASIPCPPESAESP